MIHMTPCPGQSALVHDIYAFEARDIAKRAGAVEEGVHFVDTGYRRKMFTFFFNKQGTEIGYLLHTMAIYCQHSEPREWPERYKAELTIEMYK